MSGKQDMGRNSTAATPTAPDLKLFKIVAVVDWLDVEFSTTEPTQARHLKGQSDGAFSFVKGVDLQTGKEYPQGRTSTTTSRFIARIQSPERFATVRAALEVPRIKGRIDHGKPIRIPGMEISLDAYRKPGTTDEQLAAMTARMLRGITRPDGQHLRSYKGAGTVGRIITHQQIERHALEGKTFMYGNKNDDYIVRGYLKNYDTRPNEIGKNERIPLEDTLDHRARVEVRLQGQRCPIQTLDELGAFKFEALAKHFKFQETDGNAGALMQLITDRSPSIGGVIGEEGKRIAAFGNQGRARKTLPASRASNLGERAGKALGGLSEKWQKKAGRGGYRHSGSITQRPARNDENSPCLTPSGSGVNGASDAVSQCAENPQEHWAEVAPGQGVNHPASTLQEGDGLNTSLSDHPGQGDAPATSTHQAHHAASATGAPSVDGQSPSTPCTDGEGDSMAPATPAPTGDDVSSYHNMTQEDVEWLEEVLKELPRFDAGTAGD